MEVTASLNCELKAKEANLPLGDSCSVPPGHCFVFAKITVFAKSAVAVHVKLGLLLV